MLQDLVSSIRARHAGLAVALVDGGQIEALTDEGADPLDDAALFEVGSITKTMTATLLAVLVGDGRLTLETTVGEVLDADAGVTKAVTLLQLATHTSGLPRLAPNAFEGADPKDPYAHYGPAQLLEALGTVEVRPEPVEEYSNFGYQLLGHVLSVAATEPYDRLVVDRVLTPAGCLRPRCGSTESDDRRVPGYAADQQTPRWRQPLAGAGHVELGISDLARWVRANADPDSTPLGDAVRLAQHQHETRAGDTARLGWAESNGVIWHNGGTGGFHSFCGFFAGGPGIAVLTNLGGWDAVDRAALQHLVAVAESGGGQA